jgi:hypothetical protein
MPLARARRARPRVLANLSAMRSEIPPPGPAMTFDVWARAIVDGVRARLPDARAVRKGPRLVIIRHTDREARRRRARFASRSAQKNYHFP